MTGPSKAAKTSPVPPVTDRLAVALRTFGIPNTRQNIPASFKGANRGPSRNYLVFDTETTVDAAQRLRFGAYRIFKDYGLYDAGLFFDPGAMSPAETLVLKNYAVTKSIKLLTLPEFVDRVFVRVAHHWKGTMIGFNLPFDISRIADGHSNARGKMRGGYSFELVCKGKSAPRLRVKHLSRLAALFDFSGGSEPPPRGMRNQGIDAPRHRSAFVDVHTLSGALLGRSFALAELADVLETTHRKLETDEHGKELTATYLDYAIRDVQVTWECFVELKQRFAVHRLSQIPIHHVFSEASIGKGYLKQMGIRPWRDMQPDFPHGILGTIMSTYYGGRSEVHLRRVVRQVAYCDFTSMYPTVCSLMNLWRFVISKGVKWSDSTEATRRFLDRVRLTDLGRPKTWTKLRVLVEVKPGGDILPVRAKYGREAQYTIGLNHLTSHETMWYTLADCVAAKLLSGRCPKVIRAIAFEPLAPQDGLQTVELAGSADYRVDPTTDDLYRRIVERRQHVKALHKAADGPERERLKAEEAALKIVANATSYGIFMQLNVEEKDEPIAIRCHPPKGRPFLKDMDQVEEPGEYFHPLIGTLITGAARLMLAITERLVIDKRLEWAFCDTDSMAIAKPAGMADREFFAGVDSIRGWFQPLNPYAVEVDILKLEDANFRLLGRKRSAKSQPLYCLAVSSKRYVLFNLDDHGKPIIRKASAHGLGHFLAPYREDEAPPDIPAPATTMSEIGVDRWQYDLWYRIVTKALEGQPGQVDLGSLPKFGASAVSRYAATTPHLLAWFDAFNQSKRYSQQVRPFNFLLMFQVDRNALMEEWSTETATKGADDHRKALPELPRIVSPYHPNPAEAARNCFDRNTGQRVPLRLLKSYAEALAQYSIHPEAKFLNGAYTDEGPTQRRHVELTAVVYVGKEAHRWEEQSFVGIDPDAEIEYGMAPLTRKTAIADARKVADRYGQRALARSSGISFQQVSAILLGAAMPTDDTLGKLLKGATELDRLASDEREMVRSALCAIEGMIAKSSLRAVAQQFSFDPGNLVRVIRGKRKLSKILLQRVLACQSG